MVCGGDVPQRSDVGLGPAGSPFLIGVHLVQQLLGEVGDGDLAVGIAVAEALEHPLEPSRPNRAMTAF